MAENEEEDDLEAPLTSDLPANTPLTQLEEIEQILSDQIAELKVLQQGLIAKRKKTGTKTTDFVREQKSLTDSIAKASKEVRQLEKHRRQAVERVTPSLEDDIVSDFLRECSRSRREKFLELLKSLDETNDLLSL